MCKFIRERIDLVFLFFDSKIVEEMFLNKIHIFLNFNLPIYFNFLHRRPNHNIWMGRIRIVDFQEYNKQILSKKIHHISFHFKVLNYGLSKVRFWRFRTSFEHMVASFFIYTSSKEFIKFNLVDCFVINYKF